MMSKHFEVTEYKRTKLSIDDIIPERDDAI